MAPRNARQGVGKLVEYRKGQKEGNRHENRGDALPLER